MRKKTQNNTNLNTLNKNFFFFLKNVVAHTLLHCLIYWKFSVLLKLWADHTGLQFAALIAQKCANEICT